MGFSDHPRESARMVMPRNLYLSSTDATEYAWTDNRVQFQNGLGRPESLRQSPTKERCRKALLQWRWPEGFGSPSREGDRFRVPSNGSCHSNGRRHPASLASGTLFAGTRMPVWFLAICLLTQSENAMSVLERRRQL
ncbi:MAG: probable IS1595 transposase [Leptospirillum rubarum]|nr:MAG: probable IS1595 transposase [Leptospirillum rubarum]